MSDFEAIETREQFEEAVKDRLEQERETVRREFSGCLSPEAVEEKYNRECDRNTVRTEGWRLGGRKAAQIHH